MVQQVAFILVTVIAFAWAIRQYTRVRRNILLGREEEISGQSRQRWKNVLLVAFGQKKMFKNLLPAIFHLFIYVAFLVTQIELIEIFIDGIFGIHRYFADQLGSFYTFAISFIEVLSVLALVATVIFLARRNVLKIPRFRKPEMTLWPVLDANLILLGEIALIVGIIGMNSADIVLQTLDPEYYPDTGFFAISGWLGPLLLSDVPQDWLVYIERGGWWLHYLTVLAFLNYLPVSKHLHILLAFPNTYYARLTPRGQMQNMPEVMHEVRSMLGLSGDGDGEMPEEIPEFGARDIFGLSWKTLLDAYSCTECGRCTAECPANITGKKLSPRKIVMDIRDRTEEVANKLDLGAVKYCQDPDKPLNKKNFDDGRSLFDYITDEELYACTACNACVEACPVMIDPLKPILEMRRYRVLTESKGPADWMPMFTSLENTGAVWQMGEERVAWRDAVTQDTMGKEAPSDE